MLKKTYKKKQLIDKFKAGISLCMKKKKKKKEIRSNIPKLFSALDCLWNKFLAIQPNYNTYTLYSLNIIESLVTGIKQQVSILNY